MKNKQSESITIRRRGGDRLVVTHKIYGETVGRAEVKRHVDDEDDIFIGGLHAITKLSIAERNEQHAEKGRELQRHIDALKAKHPELVAPDEADPHNLKPGDRVLGRDDLVVGNHYNGLALHNKLMYGKIRGVHKVTEIDPGSECDYFRLDDEVWVGSEMLLGKIVPCGKLCVGDEVLVKERRELDSFQKEYANRIVRIEKFCNKGCCVRISGIPFSIWQRLVGKLIRFKKPTQS